MTLLREQERIEALGGNCSVIISKDHGFGTDALLLAQFAAPAGSGPCLDLGTGCGIIPLLWRRDGVASDLYGLEVQESAYSQFTRSLALCEEEGVSMERVHPVLGDLRALEDLDEAPQVAELTLYDHRLLMQYLRERHAVGAKAAMHLHMINTMRAFSIDVD